jgi:hypothetical protein
MVVYVFKFSIVISEQIYAKLICLTNYKQITYNALAQLRGIFNKRFDNKNTYF